uniref:Uncharacterized protein n=1 Tax=Palpitomonas bilix TaxID=652834 RepID=A0A7S3DG03_9EUKA|mmetsp:Transcript_35319/g.91819  ORF Transcript_35319/g.91819 Transcript_35319/m.91819 type:complete len:392 (+) Transcript_35319:344-1519(+)
MDAHIRFRFDTLSVEEQERIRKKHEEQKAMQDILRSQIEEREKYKKNHREDGGRGARAERLNIPQPVEVPSTAETGYAPQNEGGGGGGGFMLPRTQVRAANRDQHQAAFGRGGLEVKVGGEVETTAHDYPPWLNNHDYTDGPSPIKALPVPHTDGGGQQDHADFTRYRLDRMTAEERDTHVKRMEERKRMQEMLAQQVEEKKRKREMEKQRQKQEEEEEDRRIQEYLQRKGAQMHKDKRQVIANVGGNVAKESSVPVDEQAEAKPYAGRDFGPDVARPPLPVPTQVQPQPRHEGDHRGPAAVPGIDALPHAPPPARHPVNLGGNEYRDEDLMGLPKVVSARNQEVESAIVAGLEAEYEDERAQRVLANILGKARATKVQVGQRDWQRCFCY